MDATEPADGEQVAVETDATAESPQGPAPIDVSPEAIGPLVEAGPVTDGPTLPGGEGAGTDVASADAADPVVAEGADIAQAEADQPAADTEGTSTDSASGTSGPVAAADEPAEVEVEVMPGIASGAQTGRYRRVVQRVDTRNLWEHRTIPKAKISGDAFILTPNVGQVRVVFDGGETIDGRLHGVGGGRVVLDSRLGRLTLDARRADRIDRLGRQARRTSNDGQVSTKGLDLVRVRADGGIFQGHLLSREGNRVTLLLDQGMRITLESDDVRPAGGQRNVSRLRRP